MKLHPVSQGSVEWQLARAGKPTASEFDALVTPEGKVRTGQMPKSYLAQKLAEKWLGGPLASFSTFDVEQGQILEREAVPWFELEYGVSVERPGFITDDEESIGCSPDGLIGSAIHAPSMSAVCSAEVMGLEVKCPRPETHVRYLLEGELPKDYTAQVQGGMFVTGLPAWRFLSYRRGFPALVLTVERDEKFQSALSEALEWFLDALDNGWNNLVEINGGPPKRRPIAAPPPMPEAVNADPNELITP